MNIKPVSFSASNSIKSTNVSNFQTKIRTNRVDSISFTATSFPFIFKNIEGIPDPCSGIELIPPKIINGLKWPRVIKQSNNEISNKAISILAKGFGYINKLEKILLNKVVKNPEMYEELSKVKTRGNNTIKDLFPNSIKTAPNTNKKYTEELINLIKPFRKNMFNTEKTVFELLKNKHIEHPTDSINELFRRMRPEHEQILQKKQLNVVNNIQNLVSQKEELSMPEFNKLLEDTKKIIAGEDSRTHFKNKIFCTTVREFLDKTADKEFTNKISAEMSKLPTSENDVDAFIVKYSNPTINSSGNLVDREPQFIMKRFIEPSMSTTEHVFPRHPLERSGDCAGANNPTNYLVESKMYNSKRGSLPYDEFIDKVCPDMPKNTQKYIDKVISLINNGQVKDYGWYPEAIKQTLEKATKGKIELDISKLKPEFRKEQPPEEFKLFKDNEDS